MPKAVLITDYGSSSVLKVKNVTLRKILDNELLIKHEFIGINYYDIKQRMGKIKSSRLPLIIGCEGYGKIIEVPLAEKVIKVGQRVCYVSAANGAYSEERVIAKDQLIPILEDVPIEMVAGSLRKMLNAYLLLFKAFATKKDMYIMVHDACGVVSRFIVQMGSILGCKIIGTVKSTEYELGARDLGCNLVLLYDDPNLFKRVADYTEGKGVHVVYDPLGRSDISLRCLRIYGFYVVYEQNSGIVQGVRWKSLHSRSLVYTAPSFLHYYRNQLNRVLNSQEIFELIKKRQLKSHIIKRYSLDDVRQAHDDFESGVVMGSSVLVC